MVKVGQPYVPLQVYGQPMKKDLDRIVKEGNDFYHLSVRDMIVVRYDKVENR